MPPIPPKPPLPDRERHALDEMAATSVTRLGGWALAAGCLAILAIGPALELLAHRNGGKTVFDGSPAIPRPHELLATLRHSGAPAANEALRAGLHALEDRMGRESALSDRLRPATQAALLDWLEYGNSQVIVGRDSHLYFRTAYDHLVGMPFLDPAEIQRRKAAQPAAFPTEPDPVPGLVQLARNLDRRGIRFVLLPVPVKAAVHPEPLLRPAPPHSPAANRPLAALDNPSMDELETRLASAGVPVYNPLAELRALALAGETLYFPTDTHWNPRGMEVVARGLAKFIRDGNLLVERVPAGLEKRPLEYKFAGDLVGLLGLGHRAVDVPQEAPVLQEITALGGAPIGTTTADADVLLLGDSYSVVFAFDLDGRACGFGERLAFELDRPVRRFAKVATNELPKRIQWMIDDPALLDGVRLVIYEVTARAFSSTDWTGRPLDSPKHKRRKKR